MSDLISRQDAIDVCMKYNGQGYIWSCIMGDIEKLPSEESENTGCKYYCDGYCNQTGKEVL